MGRRRGWNSPRSLPSGGNRFHGQRLRCGNAGHDAGTSPGPERGPGKPVWIGLARWRRPKGVRGSGRNGCRLRGTVQGLPGTSRKADQVRFRNDQHERMKKRGAWRVVPPCQGVIPPHLPPPGRGPVRANPRNKKEGPIFLPPGLAVLEKDRSPFYAKQETCERHAAAQRIRGKAEGQAGGKNRQRLEPRIGDRAYGKKGDRHQPGLVEDVHGEGRG